MCAAVSLHLQFEFVCSEHPWMGGGAGLVEEVVVVHEVARANIVGCIGMAAR